MYLRWVEVERRTEVGGWVEGQADEWTDGVMNGYIGARRDGLVAR